MESSVTPSLVVPRLRISRQSSKYDDGLDTPQAGPSRMPFMTDTGSYNENNDDGEDAQSTPRLPIKSIPSVEPISAVQSATPTETPAARLRALLSRVPNSPSNSRDPPATPAPASDRDSDFEPPRSGTTNTPSIARESLKDLFTRALRDPGDTPQKTRRRRNSIDVSEVEASPRVRKERAKNKGKRRSLSDEEAEKPFKSGTSLRSSQAATFDILRERLANSQTQLMHQNAPFDDRYESGLSDTPADPSGNATFLRQLENSPATPPAATSTPQRSMQMPSQLQFQSNLMDQDSDMQDAMKEFDSFEDVSVPSQRPISFPPARSANSLHSTPARPHSLASTSKIHSSSRMRTTSLTRHGSTDLLDGHSSRASSSQSHADFKDHEQEREREKNREREREWNKPHPQPQPRTPELQHRHSHSHGSNSSGGRSASPMLNLTNGLARRGSINSLRSFDDGRSSRTSSIGSQAEYRERISELEKERNIEREREWNKRHPPRSRPTSSLSMHNNSPEYHERSRTQSHPARPGSVTSHLTPDFHRHYSFNDSRASSPTSSIRSRESEKEHELEVKHEVDHQRERNWNSPHPKWDPNAPHGHGRSVSPLPSSLSPRPSISHAHSHSSSLHNRSPRVESPTQRLYTGRHTLRSSLSHSSLNSAGKGSPPGPAPAPWPVREKPLTPGQLRPRSPLPPVDSHSKENGSASKSPAAASSRFGWSLPRNRSSLPPIEFDQQSPERPTHLSHSRIPSSPSPTPGSRPSSRLSGNAKPSHIPVRSPHALAGGSGLKKGHRRSLTELKESTGAIPPPVPEDFVLSTDENGHQDSVLASDEEQPSPLPTHTPALPDISISVEDESTSPPGSPPPEATDNRDEDELQDAQALAASSDTASPPLSPPPSDPILSLATPPRSQSLSSSKLEFKTPSPPKNMPELPGPPSSSEDETDDHTPERHLDFSSMKTPKPPGAWSITPRRDPLIRSHSLPDSADEFGGETTTSSGLATPVASLSRANSLPPQTPAPPGAWLATPGSERRRSILKVRFDVESEQSASEPHPTGNGSVSHPNGSPLVNPSEVSFDDTTPTPKAPSHFLSDDAIEVKEEVAMPVTPRSTPPSSLRKSPGIRVLDAFGREQIEPVKSEPATPNTPRSKSTIRIVDAMGREVEEAVDNTNEVNIEEPPVSHNEALRRVRQSISELANEVDNSGTELEFDDKRLSELNDVSKAARDARRQLSRTLRAARDAEDDLRSKYGLLRASMRKSKFLPSIIKDSRLPWDGNNALMFWGVVSLQVLLILIMYRISTARAKDIFLSQYYDPYYPELHLYVTRPDPFRLSMAHTSHWSIFSIPDTFHREGIKGVVLDAWNGVAMSAWDWQQSLWEAWGTAEPVSWPPT